MSDQPAVPRRHSTAFLGHRRLATGSLTEIAAAVKRVEGTTEPVLIFDDRTGKSFDIDTRGTEQEVLQRAALTETYSAGQTRGRPRLGVVAREVTLLPRHWEWLNEQPGGASVALRKLVETARGANRDKDRAREARDAAYYFLSGIAGDFPGFEEVSRALFANSRPRFVELMAEWPADIRNHALRLWDGA